MKADVVTNVVRRTANNPLAWLVYRACGRLATHLGKINAQAQFTRQITHRHELTEKVISELFPELTVARGPFTALRYPSSQSFGSALLPKLLGAYESELHPALGELLTRTYDTIVDVGCGEGYYAVGLALKLPTAEVYAFDTEPRVRELCSRMAELNGVAHRLHIGELCNQETLRSIPLKNKALIVSDCEGYEGRLFDSEMAAFLARHDLIIETHDFIDIELSDKMRQVFASTHDIRSIKSTDDIERVHTCRYPELQRYSLRERHAILSEWRPAIMEWLVMTSKC
jgi:hypothetical protein